jgi:hypothetical protein
VRTTRPVWHFREYRVAGMPSMREGNRALPTISGDWHLPYLLSGVDRVHSANHCNLIRKIAELLQGRYRPHQLVLTIF